MVLGAGTGGTIAANRLRRALPDDVVSTVVDKDDDHVYQPGLLFVPFGTADAEDLVRPRARQLRAGIGFTDVAVDWVDVNANRVYLVGGGVLGYDVLEVATGARLLSEETSRQAAGWVRFPGIVARRDPCLRRRMPTGAVLTGPRGRGSVAFESRIPRVVSEIMGEQFGEHAS